MPRSKNKDSYGKVNFENISGKSVPKRSGYNETPFKKAGATPTNSLKATDRNKQGNLSGGSKPMRSSGGGKGPTMKPLG